MKRIGRFYSQVAVAGIYCMFLIWGGQASAGDANLCAGDIAKFCKDVKPGAVMDCLERHENELSDECKTYEAKMGGKRVEMREEVRQLKIFREACNEDMAKFCKDVQPEQSVIEKCLSSHEGELSASCGERMKATMEERAKKKTP
ncbi:MAG: hypothetical protein M0Z71_07925 [Nitrospiraceae bacterium]|nr:hypothetical protein [Nitrospiraceae bacterium]